MNISLEQYTKKCSCGKEHKMDTQIALIEPGATAKLPQVVAKLALGGKGCIVCDENTKQYAEQAAVALAGSLSGTVPMIVLPPENLHADEKAVALVDARIPPDAGWLLAAGSGTIHDTTRYVAGQRDLAFISFPTAASVDGFLSSVCAMTWYGFKKTMSGISPVALVADSDIFSKAPYHLTAAGIGDVLGKYISLADWEISHLLTGEEICPEIVTLTRGAVDNVMASLDEIRAGGVAGCEQLMFAQALSGIGMQLWGNSRPASGAEHHLSHLWEMEAITPHTSALHGEKVGVGLLAALEEYGRIAAIQNVASHVRPYTGLPKAILRESFGDLYDSVLEENRDDPLLQVSPDTLVGRFEEVRAILDALPDRKTLQAAMERAGCMTTLEELGLDPAVLPQSLELSPFVRCRLTVMRVRGMLAL